ncbi:MAG: hypothetical protein WC705_00315 [Candidatus Paceibacterota bacterium]
MLQDFISHEPREYKYKIGKLIASSLSGFIAGVIFATIAWLAIFIILILSNKIIWL